MTYLCLVLGVFAWAFIGGAFLRDWQVSRQLRRREARDIERTIQAGVHELFGQTEEYGPDDELPPGPPKPPSLRAVWDDRPIPKPNGSGHRPKSRGKKRRR